MASRAVPTIDPGSGSQRARHETPGRRVAVLAGAGLLVIAALGAFGGLVVVERLVTDGDAGRTAADITGSPGLFGLGVAALYVVALLDVVVAWALLRFFEPVDSHLARLSAYLRVAYAAVFTVAISQLAGVPGILEQDGGAFSTDQLQAQALAKTGVFHDVWLAGLVLFGAHLAVLGLLVLRSAAAPRVIGILLGVAGAGYVFDTFYAVLRPDATLEVSTVTFVGEFLLALWLVVKGGRVFIAGDSR
ncbi:DUF4386 domain-containing protein [Amycolatopsis sp. NPDC051045]|uniref:DUF4386 domain-containing protein n=1 Tax=Amycolatopsis sp. NPDC051045 TaxID=3156922 RepID=UPI0034239E21